MKKYLYLIVLSVSFTLMSCGSGSTTNETNDSTGVVVDSVAVQVQTESVTANDSTVSEIPKENQPVK
jgi:uncharacterized protein YcfL